MTGKPSPSSVLSDAGCVGQEVYDFFSDCINIGDLINAHETATLRKKKPSVRLKITTGPGSLLISRSPIDEGFMLIMHVSADFDSGSKLISLAFHESLQTNPLRDV